jgi:hypothetical protein
LLWPKAPSPSRELLAGEGGADNLALIENALQRNVTGTALQTFGPVVDELRSTIDPATQQPKYQTEEELTTAFQKFVGVPTTEPDADGGFDVSAPDARQQAAALAGGTVPPLPENDLDGDGVADKGTPPGFGQAVRLMGFNNDNLRVERFDDGTIKVGGVLVEGAAADQALLEARDNGGVSGPGAEGDEPRRTFVGKDNNGNRIEQSNTGDVWIRGVKVPGASGYAQRALNEAMENGGADAAAGGAGGTARAVNLQSIGVDKDGFALVFNPATGSVTRGPQVGFGQIDPRVIAAEEARQFNEQQSLREGEFLRDVLANGRNFLTAAFLSRGQAGGSPLAETTQQDLLNRGFGPGSESGGLNSPLGFLSPADRATVPDFVNEGLLEQNALPGTALGPAFGGAEAAPTGGFALDSGVGVTPGLRPGEVDPATLARPAGTTFPQTSQFAVGDKPAALVNQTPKAGGGFGPSQTTGTGFAGSLGEMALAFAPPAVKDIAAGREVGSLSTAGGGGSISLASPQTLANLTADERGALDTTLQNVDQRTLGEFEQEAQQRFRGQGSRRGARAV